MEQLVRSEENWETHQNLVCFAAAHRIDLFSENGGSSSLSYRMF